MVAFLSLFSLVGTRRWAVFHLTSFIASILGYLVPRSERGWVIRDAPGFSALAWVVHKADTAQLISSSSQVSRTDDPKIPQPHSIDMDLKDPSIFPAS